MIRKTSDPKKRTAAKLSYTMAAAMLLIFPATAAAAPVIQAQKSANVNSVTAGSEIRYDISIDNQGDATAENVVVTDALDSRLEFVSSSITPTANAQIGGETVLTFNLGNIATSTATTTFSITARTDSDLSPTAAIPNTVAVTGSNISGTVVSNVANVTVTEITDVLEVQKTVTDIFQSVGEIADYTITVENTGGFTVNNIVLRDTVDAGHQVIAMPSGAQANVLADGRTEITLNRDSLAPGASFSALVQTRVKSGVQTSDALVNEVEVTSSNAETVSTFNAVEVVAQENQDGMGGVGEDEEDGLPRTGVDPNYILPVLAVLLFTLGWSVKKRLA